MFYSQAKTDTFPCGNIMVLAKPLQVMAEAFTLKIHGCMFSDATYI